MTTIINGHATICRSWPMLLSETARSTASRTGSEGGRWSASQSEGWWRTERRTHWRTKRHTWANIGEGGGRGAGGRRGSGGKEALVDTISGCGAKEGYGGSWGVARVLAGARTGVCVEQGRLFLWRQGGEGQMQGIKATSSGFG